LYFELEDMQELFECFLVGQAVHVPVAGDGLDFADELAGVVGPEGVEETEIVFEHLFVEDEQFSRLLEVPMGDLDFIALSSTATIIYLLYFCCIYADNGLRLSLSLLI
jgi:hypothetical protein